MNFSNIFKKTLRDLTNTRLALWMLCGVVALSGAIASVSDYRYNHREDVEMSIRSEEYDYMHNRSVYTEYDDFDTFNFKDIDSEGLFQKENSKNEGGFVVTAAILIGAIILAGMIVSISVKAIYDYFLIGFAIDSIEGREVKKENNIMKLIGANILIAIITYTTLILMLLLGGIFISQTSIWAIIPIIIIMGIELFVFSIIFMPLSYIAIRTPNIGVVGLIKKSFERTKGNILRISLYIIGLSLITGFVVGLGESIVGIISSIIGFNVGLVLTFVYELISGTVVIAMTTIFIVNLCMELDNMEYEIRGNSARENRRIIKEGCIKQSLGENISENDSN